MAWLFIIIFFIYFFFIFFWKAAQFCDQSQLIVTDCFPLFTLPHAAPCQRRWCSTLGPTRTTSSTYTTACEANCWTWATASRASYSRCGTKARTFPWRFAHHLTSCLLKIKYLLEKKKKSLFHQPPPTSSTLSFITLVLSQFHAPISRLTVVTIPQCVRLQCRDIWSPYTRRSRMWSCRGGRRGLLTRSSSPPSGCCLPGGTSWPDRRMKAPGEAAWKPTDVQEQPSAARTAFITKASKAIFF